MKTELALIIAGGAIALVIGIVVLAAFLSWRGTQELKELVSCDVKKLVNEGWKPPSGLMLVMLVVPPIALLELILVQLELQSLVPGFVLVDPTSLILGLGFLLAAIVAIFLGGRYKLIESFASLFNIDACIRSPLLEHNEDVWITRVEHPIPIDITPEIMEKALERAQIQTPKDEKAIEKLTTWKEAYDDGKKLFGYLLIKKKPKIMFGLCTGTKQWSEVFKGKTTPMPTNWFTIPVTSGHLDLADCGMHKVRAPDEVAKKLNLTSMNLNIYAIEDETAIEASPLVAMGYDYSFAAVYQQRAFQAEADARAKEKQVKKLTLDKFKLGTLERLPDVMRTGDAPSKGWKEMIGPYVKWIILFVIGIVALIIAVWLLGVFGIVKF